MTPDRVRRFLLENEPVRGHWVSLGQAWRALREHREYSAPVRELLGQAVAASVLLAATLKFRGTLTLQLTGNGAVRMLVAQCTHDFRFRALARADGEGAATALTPELFRFLVGDEGRLTVTLEPEERDQRYQGVVPLGGDCLAACLEEYFGSSEQLPTRLCLAAGTERCAGLLVQQLPGAAQTVDEERGTSAWQDAEGAIAGIGAARLLAASAEELLADFAGRDVRVFAGSAVRFECRCTHERVAGMLRALGRAEVEAVLAEQGAVTVTCDFCNRPYHFGPGEVERLFSESGTLH
ncbi:MAG TPA: Hsp33 family molecular chaperone HslO [Steroidobacteraceae bacterium]|nr:Hsp33 family molecular chaperone HslO [Steroidobacteraceae bacterium]